MDSDKAEYNVEVKGDTGQKTEHFHSSLNKDVLIFQLLLLFSIAVFICLFLGDKLA